MGYDWRCADCNAYVDPNETHCPYCAKEDQVKLGDMPECTCGGHSNYCNAKGTTAKPVLVVMDPGFYADLRAVVLANGADKLKLVIDSITGEN